MFRQNTPWHLAEPEAKPSRIDTKRGCACWGCLYEPHPQRGAQQGLPLENFVDLQGYHVLVEENPEEWMPWNYADTLAGLALAE